MTGNDEKKESKHLKENKMSEWMKIMLEEIERKQAEDQEALEELARRREPGDSGCEDPDGMSSADDSTQRR